jgi:hypothetical protein
MLILSNKNVVIMIGLSLLSFVSKHNTVEFVYNEQVYNEIRLIAK